MEGPHTGDVIFAALFFIAVIGWMLTRFWGRSIQREAMLADQHGYVTDQGPNFVVWLIGWFVHAVIIWPLHGLGWLISLAIPRHAQPHIASQDQDSDYGHTSQGQEAMDRPHMVDIRAMLTMAADKREHTAVFVPSGGGKTTLRNMLYIADALKLDSRGRPYQQIICDPHFTLYHPEKSPTDFRPMRDRMEVYTAPADIAMVLQRCIDLAIQRQAIYQRGNGDDMGHTIVVYIDEWPDLAGCTDPSQEVKPGGRGVYTLGDVLQVRLARLLRIARKYDIYLLLFAQDGLVNTVKLSTGLRAGFATRLCGRNTDPVTWRALMGQRSQPRLMQAGHFEMDGPLQGRFVCPLPTPAMLDHVACLEPHGYVPLMQVIPPWLMAFDAAMATDIAAATTKTNQDEAEPATLYTATWLPGEHDQAMAWLTEAMTTQGDAPSGRAFARWLYAQRGGQRSDYTGDGSFGAIAKPLYQVLQGVEV